MCALGVNVYSMYNAGAQCDIHISNTIFTGESWITDSEVMKPSPHQNGLQALLEAEYCCLLARSSVSHLQYQGFRQRPGGNIRAEGEHTCCTAKRRKDSCPLTFFQFRRTNTFRGNGPLPHSFQNTSNARNPLSSSTRNESRSKLLNTASHCVSGYLAFKLRANSSTCHTFCSMYWPSCWLENKLEDWAPGVLETSARTCASSSSEACGYAPRMVLMLCWEWLHPGPSSCSEAASMLGPMEAMSPKSGSTLIKCEVRPGGRTTLALSSCDVGWTFTDDDTWWPSTILCWLGICTYQRFWLRQGGRWARLR